MKTKIGILGSCISRDAFNSHFVHNYKDYFDLRISAQRTSMISLMQDPVNIDKKLIEIHPTNPKNKASSQFIYDDLNKNFLKKLIETEIDYLIIDNYFEVIMGILYFNDNIITNNHWDLPKTQFYKKISDKLILKIDENVDEYFYIWSRYCDLFFKFMELNCPNTKVILNKGREIDKIIKSDNTIIIDKKYTLKAKFNNSLLEKLDSYIIKNYNVHILEFDFENTYIDKNHIWGIAPIHYQKDFHHRLINELKNIINKDKLIQNPNTSKKSNISEELFKKQLQKTKLETQLLLKNIKNKTIVDSLKIYNTARIDIKNYGSKNNKIKLLNKNIPVSRINFPKWFKSNEGEGIVLESEKNSINFKFECINDGFLKIYFRGIDFRDKNSTRLPVYIDFIFLKINNELIFNTSNLVWHDEPYIFEKKVKNSEIINVHVKWLPFNKNSIYKPKNH